MKTTNKLKVASRLGAVALAATAYVFLGSNQAGVEVKKDFHNHIAQAETLFRTVDHPQGPDIPENQRENTRAELESTVCPGAGQLCAVAISPPDPTNQIFWDGGSNKF